MVATTRVRFPDWTVVFGLSLAECSISTIQAVFLVIFLDSTFDFMVTMTCVFVALPFISLEHNLCSMKVFFFPKDYHEGQICDVFSIFNQIRVCNVFFTLIMI